MPGTMSSSVVDDERQQMSVLISVHGVQPPTDDEWEQYVRHCDELMRRHRGDTSRIGALSVTAGGGPTAGQRERLNGVTAGKSVRVSIVTPSAVARGIVTALSWFNPAVRAFAPQRFPAALAHLALSTHMQSVARARLASLRAEAREALPVIEVALATIDARASVAQSARP